jgi:hypothetical protein
MLDINMIRKLFIVFVLLLSSFVYSQKNYINYNLMGQTQYVGIGWERSYLKRTISHEIGLGVLSLSLGIRGYLFKDVNRFYFGCSHLIQFIPSNAGWKTYPHIGLSREIGNTRYGFEVGSNIQWWDRIPYYSLGFGLKISKKF